MVERPIFVDDERVLEAVARVADAAGKLLDDICPGLAGADGASFRRQLTEHLQAMLAGKAGATVPDPALPQRLFGADAFGDPYDVRSLPRSRPGMGYAVQLLDSDQILDRASGRFLSIRDPQLSGLFLSFHDAYAAARATVLAGKIDPREEPLAIVPAYHDATMQRHVLIYGVLTAQP